jgi:tubulin-folding cofactor B
MSFTTAADIAVQVTVPNDTKPNSAPLVSGERRITPSWTIAQLKAKLEPVTGIPSSAQSLRTRNLEGTSWIALDNDNTQVGDPRYALRKGSEIEIHDTRPASARQTINFSDLSSVEKYQMPESQYEKLEDSVLAWKRRQKLGRFDPHAKSADVLAVERLKHDQNVIKQRGIEVGSRCRVGTDDSRRGVVRFVGEVPGLGGAKEAGCIWVGIELDEPVGRNDGRVSVEGEDGQHEMRRIFQCEDKFGVFSRPEKVEVGDFPPMDDLMDEDMEEI